jgi:GH24 family phage-related lysozyme (muramidase)
MPTLQQLLKKREGCRNDVYLDTLGRPTVGIGHLVNPTDKLKLGDLIDDARIAEFFRHDSRKAVAAAQAQAAKAKIKDKVFIVYLASVNFQLGTKWYKTFKKTWSYILEKKYEEAALEVKKSRWYRQTPVRGKDFHKALLHLVGKSDADDDR